MYEENKQHIKKDLYAKIDKLLRRECFYCGPIMIDMIDAELTEVSKPIKTYTRKGLGQGVASLNNDWDII